MKTIAVLAVSFCLVSAAMAQNAPAPAPAPAAPAPAATAAPADAAGTTCQSQVAAKKLKGAALEELGDEVLQGRRHGGEAQGRGSDELHQEVRRRRYQGLSFGASAPLQSRTIGAARGLDPAGGATLNPRLA